MSLKRDELNAEGWRASSRHCPSQLFFLFVLVFGTFLSCDGGFVHCERYAALHVGMWRMGEKFNSAWLVVSMHREVFWLDEQEHDLSWLVKLSRTHIGAISAQDSTMHLGEVFFLSIHGYCAYSHPCIYLKEGQITYTRHRTQYAWLWILVHASLASSVFSSQGELSHLFMTVVRSLSYVCLLCEFCEG